METETKKSAFAEVIEEIEAKRKEARKYATTKTAQVYLQAFYWELMYTFGYKDKINEYIKEAIQCYANILQDKEIKKRQGNTDTNNENAEMVHMKEKIQKAIEILQR